MNYFERKLNFTICEVKFYIYILTVPEQKPLVVKD